MGAPGQGDEENRVNKVDKEQVEFEVELHRDRTTENLRMAVKPVHDVKPEDVPECQQCGLCCCSSFVYQHGVCITQNDYQLLPEEYRRTVIIEKLPPALVDLCDREFMSLPIDKVVGVKMFACRFLMGKPGEKCNCAIYGKRPTVCREYTRGSDECLDCIDDLRKLTDVWQKDHFDGKPGLV
jgi:Fe-S-cluster containining protein